MLRLLSEINKDRDIIKNRLTVQYVQQNANADRRSIAFERRFEEHLNKDPQYVALTAELNSARNALIAKQELAQFTTDVYFD